MPVGDEHAKKALKETDKNPNHTFKSVQRLSLGDRKYQLGLDLDF